MLAREHGRQTPLGANLNELGDVVSAAALFVPFVAVAPFCGASVGFVVLLACMSEMPACSQPRSASPAAMTGQ